MRAARETFRDVFGLDLRSLAVMRIGLAGVALTDLAIRFSDFGAMYSSSGMAPVEMVRSLQRIPAWSLHLLSGADAWQATLFGVATLLAVALLVGWQTRLAAVGSWILLASVQVRMPLVLNAGDTLLRVALFWGMFLPLGAVWSVDAWRTNRRDNPSGSPTALARRRYSNPFSSAATLALIVQLALVYWFAGWAKWNDAWLQEDALGNVFKFGLYGLPLGAALSDYPALTQFFSRATVWFELLGPLLLFIPWQTARLRMIAIVGFVLLHVGIAVTMTVGLFSYAAIAVWMGMLPGEFWDRWSRFRIDARAPVDGAAHAAAGRRKLQWAGSVGVLGLLFVAIYWNVASEFAPRPMNQFDWGVRAAAHLTTLRQGWGVFGHPPRRDRWFVYQARLKNGKSIDLLSGGSAILEQKPALSSRQFSNHRWRKLHLRICSDNCAPYRQPMAEYFVRQWNATHGADEQVVRLDFYTYAQAFDQNGIGGDHVRKMLAQQVLSEGGNFAEALRNGDDF